MKSVSDNDSKGERSEPKCECHIWGKNLHKLKKKKRTKLIIYFKYVSVVSIGISVLVCKTSPISHTLTSDFGSLTRSE